MPAINANIIVQSTNLTLSPSSTNLGVTVDPINLSIYPSPPQILPGGPNTSLQYRSGNVFGGLPNATVSGNTLTFTNLANLKIDGGVNGYVLQTDGTGTLAWTAQSGGGGGGTPGGSDTQIQYNDAGVFGGMVGFTLNDSTGDVAVPGNLSASAGNIVATLGNITAAYDITSTSGLFNGDGGGLANLTAANITGTLPTPSKIANGTSNISIDSSGGKIDFTVDNFEVGTYVNTGITPNPAFFTVRGNILASKSIETASYFQGDGNAISNIQGANVSGAVGLADFATTANAVAGANVSGSVANAIYADTAGSTTGSANYAAYAGNITIANQPNITALGIISGLRTVGTYDMNLGNLTNGNLLNCRSLIAQDDITSVGGNMSAGNVSASFFIGSGFKLFDLPGSNVSGQVPNAVVSGTVYGPTQPNITSVGTLTSLGVNGTITASAITANTGVFTGDGGGLSNVTGANIVGLNSISNGTSNVRIASVDGSVSFNVGGANVAVMSTTGAAYPGFMNVNGNVEAKNDIVSLANITATSTIAGADLVGQLSSQKFIQYVGGTVGAGSSSILNFEVGNQTWEFNTTTLTQNFTLNLRGDNAGGLVSDYIDNNRMAEFTYITTNLNNNYAMTAVTIDGSSTGVATRFRTGTVPTANQRIVYNIKVLKNSNTSYEIFVDWYDTPL